MKYRIVTISLILIALALSVLFVFAAPSNVAAIAWAIVGATAVILMVAAIYFGEQTES